MFDSIEIDEEILKKTTQCECDFTCLKNGDCPGCDFKGPIADDLIFVKPKQVPLECQYALLFGYDAYICRCPTRCEIYRKYGK